jgi:hypothetical protein
LPRGDSPAHVDKVAGNDELIWLRVCMVLCLKLADRLVLLSMLMLSLLLLLFAVVAVVAVVAVAAVVAVVAVCSFFWCCFS